MLLLFAERLLCVCCVFLTKLDARVRSRSTAAVFHIICALGVASQESWMLPTCTLCLNFIFVEVYV